MLSYGRLIFFAVALAPVVRCFLHAPYRNRCTKPPARHNGLATAALTRQQKLCKVNGNARRSFATPDSAARPADPSGGLSRPPFIAVLRDVCVEDASGVARAVHAGGFNMVSVTADTPGFARVVQSIADDKLLGGMGMVVGASSVTSPDQVNMHTHVVQRHAEVSVMSQIGAFL